MQPTFIHLNIHSEYSIIDGLVRIKALVKHAREQNMPAVALTDARNLFAAIKFYTAAVAQGIKPILGADVKFYHDENPNEHYSAILLCQNNTGWHHLTELVSNAYQQGQQLNGEPLLAWSWIAAAAEGLIALSGAHRGDIGRALLNDNTDLAQTYARKWQAAFPDRYYIEVQRIGHDQEAVYIKAALGLAQQLDLPVVASNAVCFLAAEDFEAHEARVAIHDGYTLNDPKRPRLYTDQQYFRSQQAMGDLFADMPGALQNTVEIAKRCNVSLTLGNYILPDFPIPDSMTVADFFAAEARKGLEQRLAILLEPQSAEFTEQRKPYDERLAIELDVINSMGFAGYFLIVADFIQWAKQHGVPVGPGRGSGAGSLVAYALGITDLDPLEYDLLFERFLNPERVSMPDFDIDFCMDGRDRVIDYVAQRYGRECVSQIITYGTMAAKAVVRDVGRVLDHPYGFVDKIAKLIPFEIGMTLDKALAQEEALRERYNQEDDVRDLIDLAKKLEGVTRNVGKHAGGVVIAPSKLTDFTPIYCEADGSNRVTQFDKDDVERAGLVKFDFLGLRTLTIINWAVQAVNQRRQAPIDISLIPVDDKASFDLLKDCATTAVFQLESRGMKDLIKRLQPDCFEDIIALVALFRPGPLQSGMVDDFIDRKHGRAQVEYPHPDLEPILRPTYGVILYQEQVMQIAQVLAGYTLGGADLLRRAMGKKKPEEMAKQRKIFTEGAVQRGVEADTATYIFDLMEKFAGYGFNKSHSAAYALVAYQTAWLKAHYPAEFMAAVLSSDMDNTDKVVIFYDECSAMKLSVLAPSVNQGQYPFTVNDHGEIIYGLGAIKGVGESVINNIVEVRTQTGKFADLFDFCRRVDLKKVNKRAFEALIRSGAMDCFEVERSSLMATLPRALKAAEQSLRDENSGQLDLFAGMAQTTTTLTYEDVKPWTERQRLQGEKEALGFYLTGHPIDSYEDEINQFTSVRLGKLKPNHDQAVVVAGFLTAMRIIITKRGDKMAFATLDDRTGRVEIAIFSDVLQECQHLLTKDQLLIVEGDVSVDDYSGGFRMSCNKVLSIDQARKAYARQVKVKIDKTNIIDDFLDNLQRIMQPFARGTCPVCIDYWRGDARADLRLGTDWRVNPCDELLSQLRDLLGPQAVTIDYY